MNITCTIILIIAGLLDLEYECRVAPLVTLLADMLIQLDISRSHFIGCGYLLDLTVGTNGEVNLLVLCSAVNNRVGILVGEAVGRFHFFKAVVAVGQSLDMQLAVCAGLEPCLVFGHIVGSCIVEGVDIGRSGILIVRVGVSLCQLELHHPGAVVSIDKLELRTGKRITDINRSDLFPGGLGQDNFSRRFVLRFVGNDHRMSGIYLNKSVILVIVVNAVVPVLENQVFLIEFIACRRCFFYPVVGTLLDDIDLCLMCVFSHIRIRMVQILGINRTGNIGIRVVRIVSLS